MKNRKELLIIFYRNPDLGKVKTRLAATMGEEKALAIYLMMASHTKNIAEEVNVKRVVYYTDFIDREDNWANDKFDKRLQRGDDLGEKMLNAFANGFTAGYESICIVGTDCFELTSAMIAQAFKKLEEEDAVIGPSKDGGYYLLGMTSPLTRVFKNKRWSTDTVCADTIKDLKQLGLNFFQLELLTDIDEEKDLPLALNKYFPPR